MDCIYCSKQFDPSKGEGDHVIPASLGEFRGDSRFRSICPKCNSVIGKAEQQIVQSGPESFFRQIIRPHSKRLRKRGIGRPRGSLGAPAPKQIIEKGNHSELVEQFGPDPRKVKPIDQIIVRDKKNKEIHIRLFPSITVEEVKKLLNKEQLDENPKIDINCAEQNWDIYKNLIQKIWPKSKLIAGETLPAGAHNVPGKISFVVNQNYFRGIAKIAFHYFLLHSKQGFLGSEVYFAEIRHFILNGGNPDHFFLPSEDSPIKIPVGELLTGGVVTPAQWLHLVGVSENNGKAIAYVQLFIGPGTIPNPYLIFLGQWGMPVYFPKHIKTNRVYCHSYRYDCPQKEKNSSGYVVKETFTPL